MDMNVLHTATLTLTSLLCVFSYEVTVKSTDLMRCEEDKQVCVTKSRDCVPPPSAQKTLNMSCYFDESQGSMTCEWSEDSVRHAAAGVSLIFRRFKPVIYCKALFTYTEELMITARIQSSSMEIWSRPHYVYLSNAVKPSPPELRVVDATEDSVNFNWKRTSGGRCRLRYRAHSSKTWTQVEDIDSTSQKRIYSITGLRPFTEYTAAGACSQEFGIWSNWSAGVSVRTLDRAPSKSPQLCYRMEKTDSSGRLLHLMWKALDPHDAGGRILGYQVNYRRVMERQLQDRCVINVTEGVSTLEVEEGSWSVSVAAFNTAGFGPSVSLSFDTRRQKSLPSVRNVWVSSAVPAGKGLWVQWKVPTDPPPAQPVSHFDVWWRPETNTSTSRWSTVNSSTHSTLIQDVDPTESYLISVVAVYEQQCGSPQSVAASLRLGALMEPTKLKVVDVNKTSVTVTWVWQRKSGAVRVNEYRVILKSDSQQQTQALWPDQWQHTFLNLTPSSEYCLNLMADNVSTNIISVSTDFDEFPVVATVTPLLLLAVTVFIASILSRTMYKGFVHPRVSGPQHSTAGRWLMDRKHKDVIEQSILNIQDFQETDVLGVKSAIVIGPRCSEPDDETALLPLNNFELSNLRPDAEYEPGAPRTTTHCLQRHLPGDEGGEAAPHQRQGSEGSVPQTEEENRHLYCQASQQADDAVQCFRGLVADSHCTDQIMCEEDYVINSCCVEKTDAEMEQTLISVMCDTDYLPNTAVVT